MFSTRLMLALVLLAVLSLAQGGMNWWVADRAEHQVVRGRVAGDLQAGFLELSATKQRLRAWSLRALIGAEHRPGDGEMLRRKMAATIERLQALSAQADRLDRQSGDHLAEDDRRDEALRLLKASVVSLEKAIENINEQGPTRDAATAWGAIEATFDRGAGRDLREVLNESIRSEADILVRKRSAADRSLARIKLLSSATTALLTGLALVLAVHFARALRRPLAEMSAGARAFERGDLAHRIPVRGRDEFSQFGASINHMAGELSARRDQEARIRSELEGLVAERTTELEEAFNGLRQAEVRRRQLLGDISHELRTPTTAIRGESEIALRGTKDVEDYRAALTRIGQASRQMGALIDDLLMMARSDTETLHLDLQVLDIHAPLEEALVHAASVAAAREIGLTVEAADDPVLVRGDGQRLQQIMTLLLDNAVRYSHPGGDVRVAAARGIDATGAPVWRLTIADQGIGVSPEDLPHVFERTFRAANARTHRPDGTGLGLAIARTLAERQGGAVQLESAPGQGATATLILPVASSSTEAAQAR
jgi:two-component system, OmpR family, sensor kinase